MLNQSQNPEITPSLAALKSLADILNYSDLAMVLYHKSPGTKTLKLTEHKKGSFTDHLVSKENNSLPKREAKIRKPGLQAVNKVPVLVVNLFPKLPQQKTMFSEEAIKLRDYVFVFQFLNVYDNNWDYAYILVNNDLQEIIFANYKSINGALKANESFNKVIESYFQIIYPFLKEKSDAEKIKIDQANRHNKYISKLFSMNEKLKAENTRLKQKSERKIVEEFEQLVKLLTNQSTKKYIFTDSTKEFIINYKGDIENLKSQFRRTLDDLSLLDLGPLVKIEPVHIELSEFQGSVNDNLKNKKQEKAIALLDRYESAAQLAEFNGKPININTIAEHVRPVKISAPAVSLSIKKYKSEIIGLLHTREQNWMLLREKFNPIKSLIEQYIT